MIMVVAEILGILALLTLMGYISLKTKKTTTAIASGVILNIFYMVGTKIELISASFMKHVLNAIPMASSQISDNLSGFSFNFGMWEPYAIMLEISMVFILSMVALAVSINYS